MIWHRSLLWGLILASFLKFVRLVGSQSALPINRLVTKITKVKFPSHDGVTVLNYQRSVHRVEVFLSFQEIEPQEKIKRNIRLLSWNRLLGLLVKLLQNIENRRLVALADFEKVVWKRAPPFLFKLI